MARNAAAGDDIWRERLANTVAVWRPQHLGAPVRVEDLAAALATLATAEQARDQAREHVETLEAVMRSDETLNRLQADSAQLRRVNLDLVHRVDAAEQRATRMEALEAAARAYVAYGTEHPLLVGCGGGRRYWDAVVEAVVALDASPAAE